MRAMLSFLGVLGALSSWRFSAWIGAGTGRWIKILIFLAAWLYSQTFWIVTALPRMVAIRIPQWIELICSLSAPWLGTSLCLFLALDLLRLCPMVAFSDAQRRWTALGGWSFVALFILWGLWTAAHPVIRRYDLVLPSLQRPLKALVVSDFHLGSLGMPKHKLAKTAEMIAQEAPDVVLIAGDVLDWDFAPLEDPEVLELLSRIRAPLGVFACLGNHDNFMGMQSTIVEVLARSGIRALYDEAVTVPEAGLTIAGRADPSGFRARRDRKNLADLTERPRPGETLILLDHNPERFSEAADYGAALQISGHTHNGQYFPANLLVKFFYEKPWGVLRKGGSTLFTTCGVGTWGAPVRQGSVAEIAVLNLTPERG